MLFPFGLIKNKNIKPHSNTPFFRFAYLKELSRSDCGFGRMKMLDCECSRLSPTEHLESSFKLDTFLCVTRILAPAVMFCDFTELKN